MPVLSVAEILDGDTLGLSSGLDDLLIVEIGGRRVLYALNRAENRLLELSVAADGGLSAVDGIFFAGTISAGTEPQLAEGRTASGEAFLMVSGLSSAAGQRITLSATGELGLQAALAGVGEVRQPVILEPDGTPVLVSAEPSGGLSVYSDAGSGFSELAGLADAPDTYLADMAASVGFVADGISYVATASASEHGVTLASVSATGLGVTGSIGAADGLPVGAPADLAAFTQWGASWLVLASQGTSSLSVLEVEGGVPRLADHVHDTQDTRFQGASQVAVATYADFAFVAVGGAEGGVSVFTVLPGGRLVHLASLAEDETVPLDRVTALETFVAGDALQVLAGSGNEAGLARLDFDLSQAGALRIAADDGLGVSGTVLDDQVIGSVAGEVLSGMAGDDILFDGYGTDTLAGGAGADLFVLAADGVPDVILDFEPGRDRLDLSAFDFLYDVAQLTLVPTASGGTLSFGGETLEITTAGSLPLTAAILTTADILNIDRPPFLLIGREIVGTAAAEDLNGGPGNDTISGLGGNDGLAGGSGLDVLAGNQGDDTVRGDGGDDTLYGGLGDDLLFGGDGNDVIFGDDIA